MRKPIKYAPEVRERAVRPVREHEREPRSGRRSARSPKIGRTAEILRGGGKQSAMKAVGRG